MTQNLRLVEVPVTPEVVFQLNDTVYYKNSVSPSIILNENDAAYALRNKDLIFKVFRMEADVVSVLTDISWSEYLYMKKEVDIMATNTLKSIFLKLIAAYEAEVNPPVEEPSPEEPSDPEVING